MTGWDKRKIPKERMGGNNGAEKEAGLVDRVPKDGIRK